MEGNQHVMNSTCVDIPSLLHVLCVLPLYLGTRGTERIQYVARLPRLDQEYNFSIKLSVRH